MDHYGQGGPPGYPQTSPGGNQQNNGAASPAYYPYQAQGNGGPPPGGIPQRRPGAPAAQPQRTGSPAQRRIDQTTYYSPNPIHGGHGMNPYTGQPLSGLFPSSPYSNYQQQAAAGQQGNTGGPGSIDGRDRSRSPGIPADYSQDETGSVASGSKGSKVGSYGAYPLSPMRKPRDGSYGQQGVNSVGRMASGGHWQPNPNEPTLEYPELWPGLDMCRQSLTNLSKALFINFTHMTHLLLQGNRLHYLPAEIGLLTNLTHLDLMDNMLKELPPEIGNCMALQELLVSNNPLVTLPAEFGRLFQLKNLQADGCPLGAPWNKWLAEGTSTLVRQAVDNMPTPREPYRREWIELADAKEVQGKEIFTVFDYNVLGDKFATQQVYGYCASWALDWDYRKKHILEDILNYNGDILCLQEIEGGEFEDFFKPELQQRGYDGIYRAKARARTMRKDDSRKVDGCAIFFRRSKFRLVNEHVMEFSSLASGMAGGNVQGNEDLLNRVMPQDNIAIVAILESVASNKRLAVANAHIHWDPKYTDVKLIQSVILMNELKNVVQKQGLNTRGNSPNIIICGDFNSLADSGVLEFIRNGHIPGNHPDLGGHQYAVLSEGTEHHFRLRSAYSDRNELDFTNCTYEFTGTIDYIFYSCDTMGLVSLLGGVEESYVRQFVACPNAHFSSDHLPISARFYLKDSSETGGKGASSDIRRGSAFNFSKMGGGGGKGGTRIGG
eukprot:Clim_evm25s224 gene=Clim_evmTU25s224